MAHHGAHTAHSEIGKDGQPHGHHVMSAMSLLGILLILMAFTGFTVYTAKEWHLGILGNASLAILIATVKATLVCMYFMHLKYDNHFYTVAMLSCVCGVILFLFFSMADLGSRHWVDPERATLLVPVPADKVGKHRYHDPLLAQGRTVYMANCSTCHGPRGEGLRNLGTPLVVKGAHDSFASVPAVENAPDGELFALIQQGRAPNDPKNRSGLNKPAKAGNPALTDEQIMLAIKFVRAMGEAAHGHKVDLNAEAHHDVGQPAPQAESSGGESPAVQPASPPQPGDAPATPPAASPNTPPKAPPHR